MDIIIKKILEIKKKPEIYIGKKSIERLSMFLSGYILRQYEIDTEYKSSFENFSDFVNNYYNTKSRGAGWGHVISNYVGDDEKAVDMFYELLDKFMKENEIFEL